MFQKPDFVLKEQEAARAQGLRKRDVLYQVVRCTRCGQDAILRSRLARNEFTSVEGAERRCLEIILRESEARCSRCESTQLDRYVGRHVFLMYSERAAGHLSVTLRMDRESDGRIKVVRQVWIVHDTGPAEEIDAGDDRLSAFWDESRIRCRVSGADPVGAIQALETLREELSDHPLLLRELGHCCVAADQEARAALYFEASVRADPDQAETRRAVGALLSRFGLFDRAAEHLLAAWKIKEDSAHLPEVIRTAYRARRLGALEAAGRALLAAEGESVLGRLALVCVASAADVAAAHRAWSDLHRAATLDGDRNLIATAAHWRRIYALPLPDWVPSLSQAAFADALADELAAHDLHVARDTTIWSGATPLSFPVVATRPDTGAVIRFALTEAVASPVLDLWVSAAARACAEDGAALAVLGRQPLSFAALHWASGAPDAALQLAADADTSMAVNSENAAAFASTAATHFGRDLDVSAASIADVDAILARLHAHGFGDICFALQCQVASYVGAVLEQTVRGAWVDGDELDPRVVQLPSGDQLGVLARVRRAVIHGTSESLGRLLGPILWGEE